MKVEFWGVRGSTPVSGRNYVRYGGHTPCATVESSTGARIIVDAGTGLKTLGESLIGGAADDKLELHLLLTHFHLDHIIGLPFFAPLYSPRAAIHFHAAALPRETEKYLSGLMLGRYFPVAFRETASQKVFHRVGEDSWSIGKLKISSCPLIHPQGSVAYKIEEKDAHVVFATDTEPPEQGMDERLAGFIAGVEYFIYDATFTPKEYRMRQGWGHSTWLEGTKLARHAGVRHLVLSHLNPDHADGRVDDMVRLARREFRQTAAAREGVSIEI
jgi:phosphoribosyl 1,2-cyclic phosphodiesterase